MKTYPLSALLGRMKYITRWSLMRNGRPETLSEHTADTALLAHMLSTLKFLMVVLFAWITVWCALARPLPVWFLPVVLIALFGDMIYWLVRLFRAR